MAIDYREKCLDAHGEKCAVCDYDEDIEAHHIDCDRSNNAVDNLIPLCKRCHSKVHSFQDVSGKLAELQDQVPDARIGPESTSDSPTSVRLKSDCKEVLDTMKPDGITQSLFIKRCLKMSTPFDRMIQISKRHDEAGKAPFCPGCHKRGKESEGYYIGHVCNTPECEVKVYEKIPDKERGLNY